MKNFYNKNRKMFRSVVGAMVMVLLACAYSYGQTYSISICPQNTYRWTGHVESNYDINNDVIWVGKPTVGNACRGWLVMDLGTGNPCSSYPGIPTNAIIQSIELGLYPYNPGGSNHNLEVHHLSCNPVTATASTLWTDIADGAIFYDGYAFANIEDQWVTITLNSAAITDLQNKVSSSSGCWSSGFWAIGLYEYGDNDNTPHIYGYSNSTYRPGCVITYTTPCNLPTSLSATPTGQTTANLDWSNASGYVLQYEVRYKPTTSSTWTTQYSSSSSYSVSGLICGTTYDWEVRTDCSCDIIYNYSSWVIGNDFTTNACPCNTPSSLSATSTGQTTANIDWSDVSGATGYEVRYKPTTSSTWSTQTPSSSSYSASGLTCGTTYDWEVRTNCGSGNYSSWVTGSDFTTDACPCNTPTGLSSSATGQTTADLDWWTGSGAIGWDVRYKPITSSIWTTLTTSNSYYNLTGLSCGTTYEWEVRANCGSGNYSSWNVGAYIITDACPGNPPVANFSGNPTTVIVGNSVQFTDLSSNSPTSWLWSFPGGTPTSSTAQNPTITYNTVGTYNVTLTATNAYGNNSNQKTNYITVSDQPCSSISSYPYEESFEGAFPPLCWTKNNPDGGTGWAQISSGTSPLPGWVGGTMSVPTGGGTQAIYCTWNTGSSTQGAPNDQWLITPSFYINNSNLQLSFYMFWSGHYQDYIDIKISTSGNQITNFTTTLLQIDTTDLIHDSWKLFNIPLNTYYGQNIYFAFNEHVSDNWNEGAFIAIDLVKVKNTGVQNQSPIISISSPYNSQTFSTANITVSGTASDPDGSVSLVQVQVNGGSWQNASGTTSWSKSVTLQSGSNTIKAKAQDNNGAWSTEPSINVNCTVGIEDIAFITTLAIFPNPTTGSFTISMEITEAKDFGFKLFDITGQEIWSEAPAKHVVGKYSNEIDLSKYAKGTYTLQIISSEGVMNRKVVVE